MTTEDFKDFEDEKGPVQDAQGPFSRRFGNEKQRSTGNDDVGDLFENAVPAPGFAPLPKGRYTATIIGGGFFSSSKGTPGYEIEFRITEGEFTKRHVRYRGYLTERSVPITKALLAQLGITTRQQLNDAPPTGMICKIYVAAEAMDDGRTFTKVKSFTVVGRGPNPLMHAIFPAEAN